MENEEPLTLERLAAMMANGFADMREEFAALETHLGDLGEKVDQHRQETKDGFAAVRAVMGGLSHSLADHEERIKELEGE